MLPSSYLLYIVMNSLYSGAMTETLPTHGFQFLSDKEIHKFTLAKLNSIGVDDDTDYILEVDLLYPKHLHDDHSDYPLAPESLEITEDMLSPYAKELRAELGRKPMKNNVKLVPNLYNKTNYVTHYRNLQLYVKMGLKITKVHKIMSFRQSRWMKPYIDFNIDKRKQAKTPFEKGFYKFANNSCFGKTMEDLRRRIDVHLVTNQVSAERYVARPTFETFEIINDDITMVKNRVAKIKWTKPTYLGFAILELSKAAMYRHHYEKLLPRYGRDRLKLHMTDTDSLLYSIQTEDLYEDLREMAEDYDFSDYPASHPLHSNANKKEHFKFKDECCGVPAIEFVGLRSKMYSLAVTSESSKSTAKGIKASYQKKVTKCIVTVCSIRKPQKRHFT